MAQTIFPPVGGITLPSFTQDRGATLVDPITKSTFTKPVVYRDTNACGVEAYEKGTVAINVNQLINCVPTQAASVSIKVIAPIGTSANDLNAFIDSAQTNLVSAMTGAPA